jgi:hypothetical protein
MEIEFLCDQCRNPNQLEVSHTAAVSCDHCGKSYGLIGDAFNEKQELEFCIICRCRDLYVQKDFNRKVGCLIAIIGAVLAPFTKLISLFVCALIDLILYRALGSITICYRCKSIYRNFPLNSRHEAFNLGINDRYRSAER